MTQFLKAALVAFAGTGAVSMAGEPPATAPDGKPGKAEDKAASPLEGVYTIVSGEKDGKALPEDKHKGSIVRFTPTGIVGTDKDRKEFFASSYTLDQTKTPWVIKMKSTAPKEAEATGLVKKDGDTVTIVYSLPGADAPTEFKTKASQHLFVLKMAKPVDTKKTEKNP